MYIQLYVNIKFLFNIFFPWFYYNILFVSFVWKNVVHFAVHRSEGWGFVKQIRKNKFNGYLCMGEEVWKSTVMTWN
jgi:hypothetical protein